MKKYIEKTIMILGVTALFFTTLAIVFFILQTQGCVSPEILADHNQSQASKISREIDTESSSSAVYSDCLHSNVGKAAGQNTMICQPLQKYYIRKNKYLTCKNEPTKEAKTDCMNALK